MFADLGCCALLSLALAGEPETLAMAAPVASDSLPCRLTTRAVGGKAAGRGELVRPSGVACDPFGRLTVSDAALHRLQRYDRHGSWLSEAGSLGSGPGELRWPGAVAVLGTRGVVVLDQENRRVVGYDLAGRLLGTLIDLDEASLVEAVGRIEPIDLAADRGGVVYLADADRDRLLVFDFAGRYVRTLGGYGSRPGSFRGLSGVAVGRNGELFAAERGQRRLQRLDATGRVLGSWPLPVEPARGALAVAVDDSGRVAVADQAGGAVWVFSEAGVPLASLARLKSPRALAFALDGSLLVAEAGAAQVRRLGLEPCPDAPVAPAK